MPPPGTPLPHRSRASARACRRPAATLRRRASALPGTASASASRFAATQPSNVVGSGSAACSLQHCLQAAALPLAAQPQGVRASVFACFFLGSSASPAPAPRSTAAAAGDVLTLLSPPRCASMVNASWPDVVRSPRLAQAALHLSAHRASCCAGLTAGRTRGRVPRMVSTCEPVAAGAWTSSGRRLAAGVVCENRAAQLSWRSCFVEVVVAAAASCLSPPRACCRQGLQRAAADKEACGLACLCSWLAAVALASATLLLLPLARGSGTLLLPQARRRLLRTRRLLLRTRRRLLRTKRLLQRAAGGCGGCAAGAAAGEAEARRRCSAYATAALPGERRRGRFCERAERARVPLRTRLPLRRGGFAAAEARPAARQLRRHCLLSLAAWRGDEVTRWRAAPVLGGSTLGLAAAL